MMSWVPPSGIASRAFRMMFVNTSRSSDGWPAMGRREPRLVVSRNAVPAASASSFHFTLVKLMASLTISFERGEMLHKQGLLRDVTEQKRLEEQLVQSEKLKARAADVVRALCERHAIEAVAIGNGTASRETLAFVRSLGLPASVAVELVNESGASVYSASKAAREEFPDKDVTVRGAVSNANQRAPSRITALACTIRKGPCQKSRSSNEKCLLSGSRVSSTSEEPAAQYSHRPRTAERPTRAMKKTSVVQSTAKIIR